MRDRKHPTLRFYLFEKLDKETAGGRKAREQRKRDYPTLVVHDVKAEAAFEFYCRLKISGLHFFVI